MTTQKSLSVIVPLYNKEVFIESTLDNISQLLNSVDYEIIVIENGSTDNSKIVLENYIISRNNIRVKSITSKITG